MNRLTIDGVCVELDGMCAHPPVVNAAASATLTVDIRSVADNHASIADAMANVWLAGRPPLLVRVARYSEADAMLGRALASGAFIGGNVANAYSWKGLRVAGWCPLGSGVIGYWLRDSLEGQQQ